MVRTANARGEYILDTVGLNREEYLRHGAQLLLCALTNLNTQ